MTLRSRGFVVCALLVSVTTTTALDGWAQAKANGEHSARSVSDPKAGAEALFEEGVALSDQGRWPDACKKFEGSQSLDVAVGTLLRLADCYERIGRLASAWARFREARSLAQAQAMPDRERIAALRADALDQKMARITIKVPATMPAGFEVVLGDALVPRASWGSAMPVDAGTAVVTASAPGYLPFRRQVAVPEAGGARLIVIIPTLEAAPSARAARGEPSAPKRGRPRAPVSDPNAGYTARALGVTFAVVGGVGLATGGALAVLSSRRNDESLEQCPAGPRLCTPRGVQLRDEAGELADMATISAAVGGGLAATGIVVYLVGSSQGSKEHVALDVTPDVAARGATLRARGAF